MSAVRPGHPRVARALLALLAGLSLLFSSCGGNTFPPPGTSVLTVTTTNTRFASYVVSVMSIVLTGPNGAYAYALISPEYMDLARLTDIGEVINASAVVSGTYTSAQITIDYTNASIWANNNGQPVNVVPLLPGGTAASTSVVNVTFDPAHPLVINYGVSQRVHLNLDVDAFNSVNLAATPANVTVQPYVTMSEPPEDATPLRWRGAFVLAQDGSFIMNTRPFADSINQPQGAVTVNTTAQTYFNVDGVTYTGAAGLAALKTVAQTNFSIAAYGTLGSLAGITPSFNATTVIAGTGLEDGLSAHLTGVVTARSGNTLTVRGDLVVPQFYGLINFLAGATVKVASTTLVSQDGVAAAGLSAQSISVGQEVDVGGVYLPDPTTNVTTLDSTAGQIRLTRTRAWGTLSAATISSATLDLLQLGEFAPAAYNFAGTATGGGAVDPAAYPVSTGAIDESGTAAGTLLAVDGFVTPFGAAPPAFDATAVTKGSATAQVLVVEWPKGSTAPFTSNSANGLIVNLGSADLGTLHSIYTGPQALDLTSLPASPLITATGASGTLVLGVGSTTQTAGISIFNSASAYATAVGSALNGTNKAFRLTAIGQYNSASNTFVAPRINVALVE